MGSLQPPPHDQRVEVVEVGRAALLLLAFLALYWLLNGLVLWWAYSINVQIHGGYYDRNRALALVAKMALIVTVLTSVIWVLAKRRKVTDLRWQLGWDVTWKTWIAQVVYVAIVVVRRQLWTPSQGLSDSAMFLPIVGCTNAKFLSEFRWLSFIIHVVPIMGLISGALYYAQARALRFLRARARA